MTLLAENYFYPKATLVDWLSGLNTGMADVRGDVDFAYFLETALQSTPRGPTACAAYAGTDTIESNLERGGVALKRQVWAICAVIPGGGTTEARAAQEVAAGRFCGQVQAGYGRIRIPGCGRAVLLRGPVIKRHAGGSLVVYFFIGLPLVVGG